MAYLDHIQTHGYTRWFNATYITNKSLQYDIVFTQSHEPLTDTLVIELVNVEKEGVVLSPHLPIWLEIHDHLRTKAFEYLHPFTESLGKGL